MNLKQLINFYQSQKPIKIKENKDLVIMSFNIRCISDLDKGDNYYKVRMPLIKKLIEEENPDVIGVQEAKVKQYEYLLKILKEYGYEYTRRDTRKDGESTPLFYKKNRLEALEKSTFWLSETYEVMSNTFNGRCFRTCSYIKFLDKKNNKQFYVLNTHLDHVNEEARLKGVNIIKKVIKVRGIDKLPHMIIGDMNDFYSSLPINELFTNYIDASKFNHKEDEITFHNYGKDSQKIDYIAMSEGFKQLDYKVIKNKYNNIFPSDHYPIEVIVSL